MQNPFATDRILKRTNTRIQPDAFLWQWLGDALLDRARLINRAFKKVGVIAPTRLFASRLHSARPDWGVEDATALAPSCFDALVMLGLPAVTNDVPQLLADVYASLNADGLFLAGFFGGNSFAELRTVLLQAEADTTGGAAARVAPMIDPGSAASLMQHAGFDLPVIDHESASLTYERPTGLIADLRAANATAVLHSVHPLSRPAWARATSLYQQLFADGRGRCVAGVQGVFLSGWRAK